LSIVFYAHSFDNVKDVNATLGSACANVQIVALGGQIYEMVFLIIFFFFLIFLVSYGVCFQKFGVRTSTGDFWRHYSWTFMALGGLFDAGHLCCGNLK
jgi:hypothetical protein